MSHTLNVSENHQQQNKKESFWSIFLISYLYFIQGIFLILPHTITLTYKQIPSYQILGMFAAATLPFSFKFLTAPFIEKYSSLNYGRRKTWIVISLFITSLMLYIISFFSQDPQHQTEVAILFFIIIFFVSLEDISTDGLGIKQLRRPQLSSMLQSIWQQIGIVIGSLFFIQLTSQRFASYLGYNQPLMTVPQFIRFLIFFTIIPTGFIHFFFKQKRDPKEQVISKISLLKVIKHYRHFINPKYKVCRQSIFLVIVLQGFTFFSSGYGVELIKNNILKKEDLTTIQNLALPIIFLCTYILSKITTKKNLQTYQYRIFTVRIIFYLVVFFLMLRGYYEVCTIIIIASLLGGIQFYFQGIVMNSFQDSQFEGIGVTMLASMSNLGRNPTIHLQLIGKFGYRNCCMFGFGLMITTWLFIKMFYRWINSGQQESRIQDKDQKKD